MSDGNGVTERRRLLSKTHGTLAAAWQMLEGRCLMLANDHAMPGLSAAKLGAA